MSATNLLPCPFCGAQPRAYGAQIMTDGECHESLDCDNSDCPVCPSTGYLPWVEAITAWNTRATTSDTHPLTPTGVADSPAPQTGSNALAEALKLPEVVALVDAIEIGVRQYGAMRTVNLEFYERSRAALKAVE